MIEMFKMRASAVGNIMAKPRAKDEELSEGAKTYLERYAKEFVYDFQSFHGSKATRKGTEVEPVSIDLYNHVFFKNYQKNTERRTVGLLTGEPDLVTDDTIIDIKSSWSLSTFPATAKEAHNTLYEWQVRAYCYLFDKQYAEVAFCLVDTPDHLIGYDDPAEHSFGHIDPGLRITVVKYERDSEKEQQMLDKINLASVYWKTVVQDIVKNHDQLTD